MNWIDPNDKTQAKYLPWIGEKCLISYKGRFTREPIRVDLSKPGTARPQRDFRHGIASGHRGRKRHNPEVTSDE